MIETQNLSKIYNKGKVNQVEAVVDANILAKDGKITVLVGPSGCGKTTLMSLIGQLLTPSNGKVLIDGEDVTSYSDQWKAIYRRSNIGFIFQHINLLPNMTAIDNVLMPLICHDVRLSDYRQRALDLLRDLGLAERSLFNVEQLSGGQQQRVAVARALITEPKVIIADEPLTFVDEASARTITDFFLRLRDERKTVIISTHAYNLAQLADTTFRMENARLT
jgi:putative ABC transport system ATP-binding protein